MEEDEIELYPGKIIEYGDNLSPTAAFQQLNFNPSVYLQDITFLNDLMAEVSGIFPNMIGAVETTSSKTATEINTKTQGQMTRLSMIVDTINQDLILSNVKKIAKLCADFKSGKETVFVNHENKQDVIEIDDFVRQGDYKYTYSDSTATTEKSQQADLVITAVERFAQVIPLNLQEIFIWYFEQKGVDNPERFLGVNEGVKEGVNGVKEPSMPENAIPVVEQIPQQAESEGIMPEQKNPQEENIEVVNTNPDKSESLLKLIKVLGKISQAKKNIDKNSFTTMISNILR